MRFTKVHIESLGYQLPSEILYSETLEQELTSVYEQLKIPSGQIAALTGVHERRLWAPHTPLSEGASQAALKALAKAHLSPSQIGILVFCGVCRDAMEPATACAVANNIGLHGKAEIIDISNACLGMLNGIIHAANAIELEQTKAALVVSCESSREIIDITVNRMKQNPTMDMFKKSLATMTGGSGACAVVLTHQSISQSCHRLKGGVSHAAPEWHQLCKWGHFQQPDDSYQFVMETDASAVLQHGVGLGLETWVDFLNTLNWASDDINKLICHQVGEAHRSTILKMINMPEDKDFSTFQYLGNIGTVSLPITAAIAEERGFLQPSDKISFLGIGSGLNCMMLGIDW